MVYDAIANGHGSIPQIALGYVKVALEAGWRVTCVARDIDESIRSEVEWLPLYVPPLLFLVQWLSARRNITAALGGRKFDVMHVHQAQIAALGDVMQCHFLTRTAWERGSLEQGRGLKASLTRFQQSGVMLAEDRYFRAWNPQTRMLFNSTLTRQEFIRLYGKPPREEVFLCDAPPFQPASDDERKQARAALLGPDAGQGVRQLVVGYLGGTDRRKGYQRLIAAMQGARRDGDELFLLLGGPGSEGLQVPELRARFKSLGMVGDTAQFYAACDVFMVPSLFEPFGLVATEAAARGVPVIATEEVGALPHLLEFGAGARWAPGEPLAPLCRDLAARRFAFNAGAARLSETFSTQRQGDRLLQIYHEVRTAKQSAPPSKTAC